MKEIARIECSKEVLDLAQAKFEDYRAKQDLLTALFEIHKYDEDDLVIKKVIGKNSEGKYIAEDAPLTQEVLKHEVGSTFKVNDEEVKLLNKNIQYK